MIKSPRKPSVREGKVGDSGPRTWEEKLGGSHTLSEWVSGKMEGRKEAVKERTQENPCEMKNVNVRADVGYTLPHLCPRCKALYTQDLTSPQSFRRGPGEEPGGLQPTGSRRIGSDWAQHGQMSTTSSQVLWHGQCYEYWYSRNSIIDKEAWLLPWHTTLADNNWNYDW